MKIILPCIIYNHMDVKTLMSVYPMLDEMMAETILHAHENGTLSKYLETWVEQEHRPMTSHVLEGSVRVDPPQKKCLPTIQENGSRAGD